MTSGFGPLSPSPQPDHHGSFGEWIGPSTGSAGAVKNDPKRTLVEPMFAKANERTYLNLR
jgi:hypothetical protein